jgi:hypothetical protein
MILRSYNRHAFQLASFGKTIMPTPEEIASRAKTVKEAINLLENAQKANRTDVALAVRRRLIDLRAQVHGAQPGSLEAEALATIYAYEQAVLGGHHASRTWQMVRKYGLVNTVERLVTSAKPSAGYAKLVEAGLSDLAFEALVLRYPGSFSSAAIEAAKRRIGQEVPLHASHKAIP